MTLFYESANELAQSDESSITFEIYQERYQDIRKKQSEMNVAIEELKLLYDKLKKRLIKEDKIISKTFINRGLRNRKKDE